jgi:hypothetical protein
MFTWRTRSAWLWLSGQVSGYYNADEAGNEYTPPRWVRFVRRSERPAVVGNNGFCPKRLTHAETERAPKENRKESQVEASVG